MDLENGEILVIFRPDRTSYIRKRNMISIEEHLDKENKRYVMKRVVGEKER